MSSPADAHPEAIPRAEFEAFLAELMHEVRNYLNMIALDCADLAEQAGPEVSDARLQAHVRNCAAFLREVRHAATPESPGAGARPTLDGMVKRVKNASAPSP